MAKVQNLQGRTVSLLRWKVLPDGRCVNPRGDVGCCLPDAVAYSDKAKRLADQGVLKLEGYNWFDADREGPTPHDQPKPAGPGEDPLKADDLTELIHVGKGRARKLNEAGLKSFQDVVDMGASELDSLLDITADAAEEIVEDARTRL